MTRAEATFACRTTLVRASCTTRNTISAGRLASHAHISPGKGGDDVVFQLHPQGYRFVTSFRLDPFPTFTEAKSGR